MLVGFREPGHNLYCGDDARKVIPEVRELIEGEQAEGAQVFFICDNHDPDDLEFQMFPVHCVMYTTADARNRDYDVEVPIDCVATFDPEAHSYALQHMEKILGAKLVQQAAYTAG